MRKTHKLTKVVVLGSLLLSSSVANANFFPIASSHPANRETSHSEAVETISDQQGCHGVSCIQEMAKDGDPNNQFFLGLLYEHGKWGVKKDLPKALELYERAAAKGVSDAQGKLGLIYSGCLTAFSSVKRNDRLALEYLWKGYSGGMGYKTCSKTGKNITTVITTLIEQLEG